MLSSHRLVIATSVVVVGLWAAPLFAQPPTGPLGDDEDAPPTPPEIIVRGTERLAWDQPAAAPADLAGVGFLVYVDGVPQSLVDASCAATAGPDGVECQAPLPALSPGLHTLSVSVGSADDVRLESPLSSSITVRQVDTDVEAVRVSAQPSPRAGPAPDVLASGLDDPTDMAALPDGSVLIAERAGRIRVFRNGALLDAAALTVPDVVTGGGGGLLSLAADRDYDTTHAVFALYTTGTGLRAARFVIAGDVVTRHTVVVDDLPVAAAAPRARIRVAPDRTLHIALDDGGTVERAGDLGSLSGKVLRLNPDGTTPTDQAPGPPVRLAGLHRPAGVAWTGRPETLWVTDNPADDAPQLLHLPTAASPLGSGHARFALPVAMGLTTAVVSIAAVAPGEADGLLVAGSAPDGPGLLRIVLETSGHIVSTTWIATSGLDSSIRALAIGVDGAVYACTAHALVRIDTTGR